MDDFDSQTRQFMESLHKQVAAAQQHVVDKAVQKHKEKCPVSHSPYDQHPGAARNSIKAVKTQDTSDAVEHQIQAGGGVAGYVIYIEYGSSNPNYPVQPFMRPVKDQVAKSALSDIAKELN